MWPDSAALVRWATLAGQHALALYALGLVVVLAAAGVLWWAAQRSARPGAAGQAPVPRRIARRFVAGFAVIVVGAWGFAALAGKLGVGRTLVRADQALSDGLHASVPAAALKAFGVLTHLADTATLTGLCSVVAIALVAAGRLGLAIGWVAAVAGNGVLNSTLKQVFARVRPLHPDAVVLEPGFSFPSGHSSGAVVAYGMLAYLGMRLLPARWHLPAVLLATALAFTVGASRVFLRVHFASDVLAGFASGLAWLALCVAAIELARRGQRRPD